MTETILRPFRTDDTAWVVRAHGVSYARDEGFDDSFGELVAAILADFNANHDPAREAGWIAERNGDRVGCIFCVSAGASTAKLRMFLLTPSARGQGLGRALVADRG